jgi:hypothetical protein
MKRGQDNLFREDFKDPSFREFVRRLTVYVETETRHGGGVLIRPGIVIGTYHTVEGAKKIWLNGRCATILEVDKAHDLVAMTVRLKPHAPIAICTRFCADQPIMLMVPMHGGKGIDRIPFFGKMADRGKAHWYTDVNCGMGSCGSGIWGLDRRLIGLANTEEDVNPAQVIPGRVIEKFVLSAQSNLSARTRKVQPEPEQISLLALQRTMRPLF